MKFYEIWYLDASQQKNCYKIIIFRLRHFLAFCQKTAKIVKKNEENWQNPNRLIKFSEIRYVDASQQKKTIFLGIWGLFVGQKTAKIDKK